MLIGTHNVNGIRAALRRGFTAFWGETQADVIALQEVRCRIEDLPPESFGEYYVAYDPGTLAGRNGVAVLTRVKPERIRTLSATAHEVTPHGAPTPIEVEGITSRALRPFAGEGRYVEVDLSDQPLRVASLYLPKGAAWPYEPDSKEKYDKKMAFMAGLARLITQSRRDAAQQGREFLIMGDFNIARDIYDIKNWRSNQKSEGFLPEERAWLNDQLGPRKLLDVVRELHPDHHGPYSWWSWRGKAFDNDAGWRIDYHLASPGLAKLAQRAWSAREASYDRRISDHCPVLAEYHL